MTLRVLAMDTPARQLAATGEAIRVLRSGGLLILPTETVYGLCADPFSREAMARLYAAKSRDPSRPIAWLVDGMPRVIAAGALVPRIAAELAEAFWPGPLTLVLDLPDGRTQGFRVPGHELSLALLRAWAAPLAATSANRSGHPDPVTAMEAISEIGGHVDLALDAGPAAGGRSSTVVRVDASGRWSILRENALTRQDIERVAL
ncbi:MAG: threonylcarbamoyl-AMP synthase [Kiritimatiellae bacterium]|nr:threonylcarbamoyl-AMP synthase [Kiritimatiellia bacterium]